MILLFHAQAVCRRSVAELGRVQQTYRDNTLSEILSLRIDLDLLGLLLAKSIEDAHGC